MLLIAGLIFFRYSGPDTQLYLVGPYQWKINTVKYTIHVFQVCRYSTYKTIMINDKY